MYDRLRSQTDVCLDFTEDSKSTEEAEESYAGDYDYSSDSDFDSEDDGTRATSFVGIGRRKSWTHRPLFQMKSRWIPLITPRHKLPNHPILLAHPQRLTQPNPTPQSWPGLPRLAIQSSFKTRPSLRKNPPTSDNRRIPRANVDLEGFRHSCYIYTQGRCSLRHAAARPPINPGSTPQGHTVSKSHLRSRFIA